jgi:hypothetical protein
MHSSKRTKGWWLEWTQHSMGHWDRTLGIMEILEYWMMLGSTCSLVSPLAYGQRQEEMHGCVLYSLVSFKTASWIPWNLQLWQNSDTSYTCHWISGSVTIIICNMNYSNLPNPTTLQSTLSKTTGYYIVKICHYNTTKLTQRINQFEGAPVLNVAEEGNWCIWWLEVRVVPSVHVQREISHFLKNVYIFFRKFHRSVAKIHISVNIFHMTGNVFVRQTVRCCHEDCEHLNITYL